MASIQLVVPELMQELDKLDELPSAATDRDFPFVLAAGERRSFTANTIFRDTGWRKRGRRGCVAREPGRRRARSASSPVGARA
jgi:hypothetical protein